MNNSVLIELHFLPSLEYFCALQVFNETIIERHEHFVKQSYRNRCYIQTTQRVEMLTVPLTGKHRRSLFRDIRVDNSRRWATGMCRTIMAAYRNSPYYEHYADELHAVLMRRHEFIYDLDMELLSFCLKALRWKKTISETGEYSQPALSRVLDLRSVIRERGDFPLRNLYKPVPYYQVFGNGFAENLSVIDLLFCKGPESSEMVTTSRGEGLNK